MPTVWTIGHSTHELSAFVALLTAHEIGLLADVRTIPRSRWNPQFNRETLSEALGSIGIAYCHLPELGGLRRPKLDSINTAWREPSFRGYADHMQTAEFESALAQLIELASGRRVAMMCAEALPSRCHRSLLADALTARALRVEHILGAGVTEAHVLRKWAHVENGRVTYPSTQLRLP